MRRDYDIVIPKSSANCGKTEGETSPLVEALLDVLWVNNRLLVEEIKVGRGGML
jgi:hypothetical protein